MSQRKTIEIQTAAGIAVFPVAYTPNRDFRGVNGRDIREQLGAAVRYTLWALRLNRRLGLKSDQDFKRYYMPANGGRSGRGPLEYVYSVEATQRIFNSGRKALTVQPEIVPMKGRGSDLTPEEIEKALPLMEILFGDRTAQSVSARDLHAALDVKKDFTNWIKNQIRRGDWVEGREFVTSYLQGENPQGGRPSEEYLCSMDMAKGIAMMSQCRRGHVVRKYFVRVEEAYNKQRLLAAKQSGGELTAEDIKLLGDIYITHNTLLGLEDRLRAVKGMSKDYPDELSSYVRKSIQWFFNVKHLHSLRPADACNAAFMIDQCAECFRYNVFDPTWLDDGFLSFVVDMKNSSRVLRHPRMLDFPKRATAEDLQRIRRYNLIQSMGEENAFQVGCLALPPAELTASEIFAALPGCADRAGFGEYSGEGGWGRCFRTQRKSVTSNK